MIPYVIISLIVIIASFIDLVEIPGYYKKCLFFVIAIVLTLFIGTRMVGPDIWTYESFYIITPKLPELLYEFPKYTLLTSFEPLFLLSYGLFKWIGASFHIFNLCFTAIFMYLFCIRLHIYTRYTLISLLIFLAYGYISGFSAIRQVMAASIFFYSLKYLIEGKVFKYVIGIIIACLFHASAIILFVFCFTYKRRFNSWFIILLMLVLIIGIYTNVLSAIAEVVLHKIPFISPAKVALYLSEEGSFIGSVSITWMILLAISLIWRRNLEVLEVNFTLYFNILWIGFAIYTISVGFGGFGRVLMYFKLIYLIILPLFIRMVKEFEGKIMANIVVAIMSVALFFAVILSDTRYVPVNRYLPYKSWLLDE